MTVYTILKEYIWLMNTIHHAGIRTPGLESCDSFASQSVRHLVSTIAMSEHPITDRLYAELDSSEVYNDSILYGYWFKPHEAFAVNIFFHKDNTYEFKYYQVDKNDSIIDKFKEGRFTIADGLISLKSEDGWDDYFNGVMYYKHNGTNFYLTDKEEGLYLVKGSD